MQLTDGEQYHDCPVHAGTEVTRRGLAQERPHCRLPQHVRQARPHLKAERSGEVSWRRPPVAHLAKKRRGRQERQRVGDDGERGAEGLDEKASKAGAGGHHHGRARGEFRVGGR